MEPRQLSRFPPFRTERGKGGAPYLWAIQIAFRRGGPPAREKEVLP